MQATLTAHHESATCSWCEKTKECVTVEFTDGFLRRGELCWPCLHKAIKVRARQEPHDPRLAAKPRVES